MQLQSMTGYGKADATTNAYRYKIEVKSLNGKFLDLNLRVPRILSSKEIEIRRLISDTLQRGSISMYINTEKNFESGEESLLNTTAIEKYHQELSSLEAKLGITNGALVSGIMQLPDVTSKEDSEELSDDDWKSIQNAITEACKQLTAFRIREGEPLKEHIRQCNKNIEQLLLQIAPFETERIENIRQKISGQLASLKNDIELDKNRFEQELIFYIEKIDINEEKQRLSNHCIYFEEILQKDPSGKKLSFIAQEIGREINTIGSKSYHAEMQKIVVQMKDELERIKEQVNNIL